MSVLRKILGVAVIIAGVTGLLFSLAGLVGVWMYKPRLTATLESVITTLDASLTTSQETMVVTEQALRATINSVAALQTTIEATAASVKDSKPLVSQLTEVLGAQLPDTIEAARSSLDAAQGGARVLDGAIESLNSFRATISASPLLSALIPVSPPDTKAAEKPLYEALGEVSTNLESLPTMFSEMSQNMDTASGNLDTIETGLTTMATNVGGITISLESYAQMLGNSKQSMQNLQAQLNAWKDSLDQMLTAAAIVLTVFFLWLLAAQVVILSQGWELFKGTANRME
jgi:hypothetical protein